MFSSAEGALLTPVVFFDLFDRPLNADELLGLSYGVALDEAQRDAVLEQLVVRGCLERVGAYLALPGRSAIVAPWYERQLVQRALWVEAQAVIGCLAGVPFVRMIAVVNSLSLGTARETSDIDLLVVVEPGWLAVARDHLLARLELLGRRARRLPKQGKVFPDIILSTDRLELASWRLEPLDMYLDYWLAHLTPVLDRAGTYAKLLGANSWLTHTFPGWRERQGRLIEPDRHREQHRESWEFWYRSLPGRALSAGQAVWYSTRMRRYRAKIGEKGTVVASASQLRIHEPDKRPEYQRAFDERWQALEGIAARQPAHMPA